MPRATQKARNQAKANKKRAQKAKNKARSSIKLRTSAREEKSKVMAFVKDKLADQQLKEAMELNRKTREEKKKGK